MLEQLGSFFNSKKLRVTAATLLIVTMSVMAISAARTAQALSVWSDSVTPAVQTDPDSTAIELGMKFRSSTDTTATGVKFYKGKDNSGTHTGSLWSVTGTKLASVQFTNETAVGWQSATFATPVALKANTTYIVSYHAPNGHYSVDEGFFATKSVTNGTITALQNGTDGGNGVYAYGSATAFPTSSYNASNYWVDVIVGATGPLDTTPPTATLTTPAPGATITGTQAITATATDNNAVQSVQFKVDGVNVGAADTTIPYQVSWDSTAVVNGPHTLTAVATDTSGNQATSPAVTVTVSNQAAATATSIWPASATPAVAADSDIVGIELGVKFRSSVPTTVTGVKFYKGAGNLGTHTGSLWSSTGDKLANVTFTNETATGWQSAMFATPVSIVPNTTYVVSYYAPNGQYASTSNYFSAAYTNNNLTALKNGTDGGNGVYRYGGTSGFPTNTFGASNYWVDIIAGTPVADTTAPTVVSTAPTANATNVALVTSSVATMSEAIAPATVTASSVRLIDSQGVTVDAAISYDSAQRQIVVTPSGPLASDQTYTVTLTTAIKDVAGNSLAQAYSWSFATVPVAPPVDVPPLAQGHGGPILLITKSGQAFSEYYSEILRAEGLNSFTTVEVSDVTSAMLANYDSVVLGDMTLSAGEVSTLTAWVNGGGNLIAMSPDEKLAGLLGLTKQSTTLADSYLKVDTSRAPGAGITNQTMQFHGSADVYTANTDTTVVALLYATSTSATANPAVTMRTVGTNGGQAVAFTYDLARSVVYTHQGNPAWSGQDRDGNGVIRPNDLFYGSMSGDVQSDYVDLNKVAIPQADEQQRLLANILLEVTADTQPLPKLSYLPYNDKAVVVMAADDHATGSGTDRLNYQIAQSAAGCLAADWECVRSTTLMYESSPMTNTQAAAFYAQGFDFGTHTTTGCQNWTPESLVASLDSDLAAFQAKYTSLPAQHVNRIHCIAWSDYVSAAKAEATRGLRVDMNYYYWPGSWVQDRPGYMTGSGLSMRFADTDGSMIDTYQLPSHLVNESGQSWPQNITTMLDRALGPEGYYGILGTHYDYSDNFDQQLIQAAKSRNVRMVSGQQILDWSDGRNASYFTNASWNNSTYSFTATIDAKLRSMGRALIPMQSKNGTIQTIEKNGTPVNYITETMKGISYAVVPVTTGEYSVTYGQDMTPPVVVSVAPAANTVGVAVGASPKINFSEPLAVETVNATNVRILDGTTPVTATVSYNGADNSVTIDPSANLAAMTTYTITVSQSITDSSGVAMTANYSSTFTTGDNRVSLWAPAAQSVLADVGADVEVGVRFTTSQNGTIARLHFYKTATDTSTSHTMNLWDQAGGLIGSATTTNETATGWQTATLATPVAINAGATYTASYRAANGVYSYTSGGLSSSVSNGSLTASAGGGVFSYGGGYPTTSFNNANYWVDVDFVSAN